MTINVVQLYLAEEGSVSNTQGLGGFASVPAMVFEGFKNKLFLHTGKRGLQGVGRRIFNRHCVQIAAVDVQLRRLRVGEVNFSEGYIALQHVLEFADVTGPIVVVERVQDILWDHADVGVELF